MRKYVLFLFLILIGGLDTFAQTGDNPCYPRKNGNRVDVYSQDELKMIFKKSGEYYDNLRSKIFNSINTAAKNAGKKWRVDASNIDDICKNTVYIPKARYEDEIINGSRVGNQIVGTKTRKTDGYYAVFQFDGVSVRYSDPNCINSQTEIFDTQREVSNALDISNVLDSRTKTSLSQPVNLNLNDGRKPFTPARVIPEMKLPVTTGNKTPYIPPLREKRQLSNFGKVAIAVVATAAAGTLAFFIWKNQQKSSSSDNGSRVTNDGHGDGGPNTNGGHP